MPHDSIGPVLYQRGPLILVDADSPGISERGIAAQGANVAECGEHDTEEYSEGMKKEMDDGKQRSMSIVLHDERLSYPSGDDKKPSCP
jgi:hypothetical protein